MAIIDFQGRAAADAWKEKLAALNDRTDDTLRNVGESLQELKNSSEGSVVDILANTGVTVIDRTEEMISSFRSILDIFEQAFQALIEKITGTTQEVEGAKSEMTNF